MFWTYLQLGFEHIADLEGYDHILFIIALCATYRFEAWKRVLILVTAFTIGHSVTLALAALKLVHLSSDLVEFLIPLTILMTAIYNIIQKSTERKNVTSYYLVALCFGLIHGLGFSNYFRSLLGKESDITLPLFSFNVGLEIGQVLIVGVILAINYVAVNGLNVKQREWNLFISGAAAGIALTMMIERAFWG